MSFSSRIGQRWAALGLGTLALISACNSESERSLDQKAQPHTITVAPDASPITRLATDVAKDIKPPVVIKPSVTPATSNAPGTSPGKSD